MKPIGVVTSIPTDPPGTGAAVDSLKTGGSSVLEFTGRATGGAGDLVLLRYFAALGWRPWKEDRPMQYDFGAVDGYFSGTYVLGTYTEADWLLWDVTGAGTFASVHGAGADLRGFR